MYYENLTIKNLYRIFAQNNREGYLRLDLNENPGGLPKEFINSVLKDFTPELISAYPETDSFTKKLADYLGTDMEHVCLVNGSAEGIRYIIQAFTSVGGRIVSVTPSYFMYHVYSEMYDRKIVEVSYQDDLTMNIADILEQMTEETQLLILLNPNNPMGNVYTDEEFKIMMDEAARKHITVVVDEAYYYFYPKTVIKYALEGEHIFVTRTFSKFFSMAGCRLGYVVGWAEGIKMVQNLCTPHNTNVFALRFAGKILESPELIEEMICSFDEGRAYLLSELIKNGYEYKGEAGNFIFIKPKSNATEMVDKMKRERKILIKTYPNIGELGDCLRVSIGGKQYMEQFMDALINLDK